MSMNPMLTSNVWWLGLSNANQMARPFAGQAYSPDSNNDVTSELRQLLGWALGIFDKLKPSSWQIYQSLASSW